VCVRVLKNVEANGKSVHLNKNSFINTNFVLEFMSRKKIAFVLSIVSGLWLAIPFVTPFNTGDPFFDLGSQGFYVMIAWGIFGITALVSRRKNKQIQQRMDI